MLLNTLDKIRQLDSENPSEWWQALDKLAPVLDDRLLVVQEHSLSEDIPHSLTVFRTRDEQPTELFATVTRAGRIVVGRTDNLHNCNILTLNDYDPHWHQPVSLCVTRRYRPLGDRVDLWVVTRRFQPDSNKPPQTVVYHGLVWIESDGNPRLKPAKDDSQLGKAGEWQAQPVNDLPQWLLRDGFTFATGTENLPSWKPEDLIWNEGRFELAVSGAHTVCLSTGDSVVLASSKRAELASNPLPLFDRVKCIAFTDENTNSPRGIAGCEDRQLFVFQQEEDRELKLCWRQSLGDFPMAIAFLDHPSDTSSPDSWPDLLVALSGGGLRRLR